MERQTKNTLTNMLREFNFCDENGNALKPGTVEDCNRHKVACRQEWPHDKQLFR
jgi:hypothetical protein